jgi:hypothetical protein
MRLPGGSYLAPRNGRGNPAKIRHIQRPSLLRRVGTQKRLSPTLWLEVIMPMSRKEARGGKAFAFPLIGIIFLLACYWLLADWQNMPMMINSALASMHWPP